MWQMFLSSFTLLMRYTDYQYGWALEEDVNVVGGNQTLLQIIHRWEVAMQDELVDLAGEQTIFNFMPRTRFIRTRHTRGFAEILSRMHDIDSDEPSPHWTSTTGSPPKWTCLTDSIHRHSRALSNRLYEQISNNIFAWGECIVQPTAWDGNFTMRELSQLFGQDSDIEGLSGLTGQKLTLQEAREVLAKMDSKNVSFVFHEEIPKR